MTKIVFYVLSEGLYRKIEYGDAGTSISRENNP
jgi:hypothetical protein